MIVRDVIAFALGALSLVSLLPDQGFSPPDEATRKAALGSLEGLSKSLARALDAEGFDPIPAPAPGDWLAAHASERKGQTYTQFLRARRNTPTSERQKLYLIPLGDFPDGSPAVERLQAFASAFFLLPVEVLPGAASKETSFTTRVNSFTGKSQALTSDVLAFLKRKLPADAFCLLGVTMEDLYPEESWNFVFGQATLRDRVGVYSFARYDPAFFGGERPRGWEKLLLRRSLKVLAHETAHMFGLAHCIHYRCLINGSNHLQEADSRPLEPCPVCLRKLQASIGFDAAERCRRLAEFFEKAGLVEEAAWAKARREWIEDGKAESKSAKPPVTGPGR
jgi:archaemetzincin